MAQREGVSYREYVVGNIPPLCFTCLKIMLDDFHQCQDCDNFELCSDCVLQTSETHPNHVFKTVELIRTSKNASDITDLEHRQFPPSLHLENLLRLTALRAEEPGLASGCFFYDTLPDSRTWIRLLTILPGGSSDRLQGSLRNISFSEPGEEVKYEALSYYWGDSSSFESIRYIYLDHKPLPICENVFDAMVRLRHQERPRVLWIDAVCINQIDIQERSHQVAQMHLVYRNAVRCVVWLGNHDATSVMALRLIQKWTSGDSSQGPLTEDHDPLEWEALFKFLSRQWFTRTWCLQEIVLNCADPLLVCGQDSFSWDMLDKHLRPENNSISRTSQAFHFRMAAWNQIRRFALLRRSHSSDHSLVGVLEAATGLRCTQPHDHVYAVLGLAREEERSQMIPDYTKSVRQVFTDTMIYSLRQGRLNALTFCTNSCTPASTDPVEMLPSWVSDWRTPMSQSSRYVNLRIHLYHAGASNRPPKMSFRSESPEALYIEVIILDQIARVTETFRVPKNRANLLRSIKGLEQEMNSQLAAIEELYADDTNGKYAIIRDTARSMCRPDPRDSDAFWRTLIGDAFGLGIGVIPSDQLVTPAPPSCSDMYGVLRYTTLPDDSQEITALCARESSQDTTILPSASSSSIPADFEPNEAEGERWSNYIEPFYRHMIWDQQFFVTKLGRIGFGGGSDARGDLLQQDDVVVVLRGTNLPLLLRKEPAEEQDTYRLVSHAYIHGIMQGEVVNFVESLPEEFKGQIEKTVLLI